MIKTNNSKQLNRFGRSVGFFQVVKVKRKLVSELETPLFRPFQGIAEKKSGPAWPSPVAETLTQPFFVIVMCLLLHVESIDFSKLGQRNCSLSNITYGLYVIQSLSKKKQINRDQWDFVDFFLVII